MPAVRCELHGKRCPTKAYGRLIVVASQVHPKIEEKGRQVMPDQFANMTPSVLGKVGYTESQRRVDEYGRKVRGGGDDNVSGHWTQRRDSQVRGGLHTNGKTDLEAHEPYRDTRPSAKHRKPVAKPRPSEVFDWDRAFSGLRRIFEEVYGENDA